MTQAPALPSIRQLVASMGRADAGPARFGAERLLETARARAEQYHSLNALAWSDWTQAAQVAAQRDAQSAQGVSCGPLHGIPVSIKDLYKVRGATMRAGTQAPLPAFEVPESAAVARLRAAGAIIFGTTNLHEIALGATGENIWTGDVKNPYDPAHQAGGSSSGAGVCVATGIGLGGLGSDTGGSVRIPANFCGVVGFKPSFGAIPLGGALHLSWTCDHAGPLARSVDDARVMFEVMSGRSTRHGGLPRAPRLGVPARWLSNRLAPAVAEVFERTLALMRTAGAQIVDVAPAALDRAWTCYTPIVRAEAAYVHRAALAAAGEGFSEAVLAPLRNGEQISAGEYFEAMRQAGQVRDELAAVLRDVDALVLPTAAVLPPRRGQADVDTPAGKVPARLAVLGQTLPFNLSGQPALTLPMGAAQGLPVGLQVVGARDADAGLLALGQWVEELIARAGVPMAELSAA